MPIRVRRLAVALLIAGGIAAGGLALWPDRRATNVPLLVEDEPPVRYHVTYHVTGPNPETIVKDVAIRRPYHARVVERQGGAIVGGALSNDDGAFQYVTTGTKGWQLLQNGRFPATQDFRPVAVLGRAIEDGSAVVLRTDDVIGRRCTVVRTGAPLGSRIVPPTEDEYVDLCIDRSGIVLSEEWILGGDLARRTVADDLDVDPDFDDEIFRAHPAVEGVRPGTAGTPIVAALTVAERVDLPAHLEAPRGFGYEGGSTHVRLVDGLIPSSTVVERYRRGIDLLEVTHGVLGSDERLQGREIALGPGRGFLDLHLTYATVTVLDGDGRYVRLRGVDPEVVLDAAARVTFRDGIPPPGSDRDQNGSSVEMRRDTPALGMAKDTA